MRRRPTFETVVNIKAEHVDGLIFTLLTTYTSGRLQVSFEADLSAVPTTAKQILEKKEEDKLCW